MLAGICKPTGRPAWSRDASIGDYGGAPDKRDSETEGRVTYALAVYRELQSQRGSAYSKSTSGTVVHVENLSLARTLSTVWFRAPEKLRANATPARADERLDYWATVLGITWHESDPKWLVRQKCAAHYVATKGNTPEGVEQAVSELLGDAFVSIITYVGTDLDNPPTPTNWPGVDPGASTYDLGGGTWLSRRCRLLVNVTQPGSMSDSAFLRLMNVDLMQLLDRLLPCWATFGWSRNDSYGFRVGISRIGIDGV